MNDTVYCYPGSTVLRNRFEIRDQTVLSEVEKKMSAFRLLQLWDHPIEGSFDLAHLCSIHRYIFQDVYEWAGELRTVDIAKGNLFCKVEFLHAEAQSIFSNLAKDIMLQNWDLAAAVRICTCYLSEINALHVFREGKGRAQREFIRELALKSGFILDYSKTTEEEMLSASKASFLRDYTPMETLMKKCLTEVCR